MGLRYVDPVARLRNEVYDLAIKLCVPKTRLLEIINTRLAGAENFSDVPRGKLPKIVELIKKDMKQ